MSKFHAEITPEGRDTPQVTISDDRPDAFAFSIAKHVETFSRQSRTCRVEVIEAEYNELDALAKAGETIGRR